jgi:hypothetical protein
MSAGHKHAGPNLLVPTPKAIATLHRLLTTGGATELMRRWQRLDIDHDIPYLLGYNVQGTVTYADRDYVNALYDDKYATQLLGEPIRTGLPPDRTLDCTVRHEHTEKIILDAENPIDLYDHHDEPGGWGAHEFATVAEHELVKHFGGDPAAYERGLKKIIDFCEHKHLQKVPRDYACAPLLDDPDENEKRIVKRLKELGVVDAFKVSKEDVDYHRVTEGDHCLICSMWQGPETAELSPCSLIDGLVRNDRWCKKFEATEPQPNHDLDHNAHAKWRSARLQRPVQHSA